MLRELGSFEDLKDQFSESVLNPNEKDKFLILAPTHLVVQATKQDHHVRTTVDYSGVNKLFAK